MRAMAPSTPLDVCCHTCHTPPGKPCKVLLSDGSKGRVACEDDGYNIVIVNKDTREPLFAIEYGGHGA